MNVRGSQKGVVFLPLNSEDGPRLKDLYDRTPGLDDVFASVGEADAESTYVALPENKTYEDKYLVGVWLDTEMIGVADAIMSFPQIGQATCGLLLIDPQQRGKGLGSDLLVHVEDAARRKGASSLVVLVQGRNQRGVEFLRTRGYSEIPSPVDATALRYSKSV